MIINLRKWFIAHTTNKRVWRVIFPDGRRTDLLTKQDAKGIVEYFGGKLWIDYYNGYFE